MTWTLDRYPTRGSATLEIDNLTDAKAFDNFGVQRPGRAFSLKLTADLQRARHARRRVPRYAARA